MAANPSVINQQTLDSIRFAYKFIQALHRELDRKNKSSNIYFTRPANMAYAVYAKQVLRKLEQAGKDLKNSINGAEG